ncbi:MAG: MarR family winged helix-turn-helix transcriptional regulator [Lapillicoccus sp.]
MAVTETVAVELLSSVSRLVRTSRTYAHLRNQELGRTGLSLGVLSRLHICAARPGDLATRLGVSPSAVSRCVAGLFERGLVERTTDPADARACFLALTGAGHDELAHLQHEQARAITGALQGWDDARADSLRELLDDFQSALAAIVLDGRHGAEHHLPDHQLPDPDGAAAEISTPTPHPHTAKAFA